VLAQPRPRESRSTRRPALSSDASQERLLSKERVLPKKLKEAKAGDVSSEKKLSSVPCKLPIICKVPELIEEIRDSCAVLKKEHLEGWHVANLHILRCLEDHEELPDITQTFFYRSCSAALQSTEQRDREAAASRLANILSFTRRVGATGGGESRFQASHRRFLTLVGLRSTKWPS
jgi:hypothetical protein